MYAKCAALTKAQQILEEIPVRSAISWSALIGGYAHHGKGVEALNCLDHIECEDDALGNVLVDMYAKCGAFLTAQEVLEDRPLRDVVSWSALISGYAQQGQGHLALKCFGQMCAEGLPPNVVTFLCLLKACASIRKLDEGEHIQDENLNQGLLKDNRLLGTALVDMYAKWGALIKAQQVVAKLHVRKVVCWNALIAAFVKHGHNEEALEGLPKMQSGNIDPDNTTIVLV
ncbi:hypothetical protein KP509_03G094200 [Ceratopteris richardii]|uniref:Pentatricopeptide repeat-containing protein n=1 Tax=Ceratopteris richardii TaxID=49495 RepID=A0A8T2V987_CERRI|nr:hypothetical protein KP509_03G094200 [Ceratopteris richardii]